MTAHKEGHLWEKWKGSRIVRGRLAENADGTSLDERFALKRAEGVGYREAFDVFFVGRVGRERFPVGDR